MRLQIAACGVVCIYLGLFGFSRIDYVNWYSLPIYYAALIPLGIVLVSLSFVPFSWLDKAARGLSPRATKRARR